MDDHSSEETPKEQPSILSLYNSHSVKDESLSAGEKGTVNTTVSTKLDLNSVDGCTFTMNRRRPLTPQIIAAAIDSSQPGSSLGVASKVPSGNSLDIYGINESLWVLVCGPGFMAHVVGNAVAKAQVDILRGYSPAAEVVLYKESFSY
jgi:hypothetical protein